jgi:hypothetical protein
VREETVVVEVVVKMIVAALSGKIIAIEGIPVPTVNASADHRRCDRWTYAASAMHHHGSLTAAMRSGNSPAAKTPDVTTAAPKTSAATTKTAGVTTAPKTTAATTKTAGVTTAAPKTTAATTVHSHRG